MLHKKLKPFPKDFLWGASTSAYQVEGANLSHGKGPSVQDVKVVPEGTSDLTVCADFYHRYKEYIALMAEMGFKVYRFSVSWSRILPQGTGEVNQEGIDFYNKRMWDVKEEDDTHVVFALVSPDGDQGFPGEVKIEVSYTITEENELKIHYHAIPDQDTLLNMTNHSYFNLSGHASGTAWNAKVWIDADAFTETDAELIPTGTVVPVEGTPMDFRKEKVVEKEIGADYTPLKLAGGYDHNWVLNGKGFRKAASAESEETGIKMEVYTDLPGIQFYSGNFLAGSKGKEGAVYEKGYGICFETQYFPDAIHKENFESPITKAGEVYDTTTVYKFC